MRRFPISWDKTLSALGFRRNVKRIKRDYYRRKNSHIESLEQRAMLAVDGVSILNNEFIDGEQLEITAAWSGPVDTNDSVRFFWDKDESGTESSGDILIGEDTDGADGWSFSVSSAFDSELEFGMNQFIASHYNDGNPISSVSTQADFIPTTEVRIPILEDAFTRGGSHSSRAKGSLANDDQLENTGYGGSQNNVQKLISQESWSDNDRRTLLKFDLNDLSNEQITEAILELNYIGSSTSGTIDLKLNEIADTWNELDVTWGTQPNLGTEVLSITHDYASGNVVSFDLTTYLQAKVAAGETTATLSVSAVDSDTSSVFASSEHATEKGPELVVKKKVIDPIDSIEVDGGVIPPGQDARVSASFASAPETVSYYLGDISAGNLLGVDTNRADGWNLTFDTSGLTQAQGTLAKIIAVPNESGTDGIAIEVETPVAVIAQTTVAIENDTYVRSSTPTSTGGGSSSQLQVERNNASWHRQSFLEIDLSQFGDNVSQAVLQIIPTNMWGVSAGDDFKLIVDATPYAGGLNEGTFTWETRPAPTGDLFGGEFLIAQSSLNQQASLDITKLVQRAIDDGQTNLLLRLTGAVGGDGIEIASSEHATHNGPKLVVSQSNIFLPGEDIVVDSLADENDGNYSAGKLSLREAIEIAKTIPGENTITFDSNLFAGGAQTILLGDEDGNGLLEATEAPSLLSLNSDLTITGPGSDQLTITASHQSRIFSTHSWQRLDIEIEGVTLAEGLAGNGAAIQVYGNNLTLDDVIFRDNFAMTLDTGDTYIGKEGGAIFFQGINNASYNRSQLTITNSTFDGNYGGRGGALYSYASYGEIVIDTTTFANNYAFYKMDYVDGVPNIHTTGNVHHGHGGAIRLGAWNAHTDGNGDGTVAIRNSTIHSNTSEIDGAGINVSGGHLTLDIENSTISSNTAKRDGGAISTAFSADWNLVNSTITNNVADRYYGGILNPSSNSSNFTLHNTILAGNHRANGVADDIHGHLVVDSSHNLIGRWLADNESSLTGPNNTIDDNLDPGLLQLADYGGKTLTHALEIDSPALGTGANDLPGLSNRDQLGLSRVSDNITSINSNSSPTSNIGSMGMTDTITVDIASDINDLGDGFTSLREAIEMAEDIPGDNTIIFDNRIFSSPETIQLKDILFDNRSHKLEISDTDGSGDRLTILGPGADLLTIDGSTNGAQTIFKIDASAQVTISGLKVEGASQFGILNKGDLTLDEVEIVGNNDGVSSTPGSILTVTQSTVAENNLTGIEANDATVTISNTTISGNAHYGVYLTGTSDSDLTNVTITENALGGIMTSLDDLAINNSLVAGNIYLDGTERDILPYLPTGELEPGEVMPLHTTVFTGENNLIGEAFDATLVDGADLADILLQPLSNNGGPTRTHAIPVGSSAVDAGNSSLSSDLKTDQRGLQRIDGSNIDIGAYELGSTINVDTILDSVNPTDNDTSLREAILLADSDPADNTIVFDDQVFSAESSIQLIDRYYDNRSHKLEISDTDGSGDRLTILGPGADLLTIDGSTNGAQTIFKIDASAQVTISGLKVEGASQFGILNKGDLTLDEVEIVGNNDGVSSTPGSILTVTQSTVAENNLTGIEANDATVTISNTTISGNAHYGVYLTGTSDSDLTNVTITENALGGIMTSLDDLAINNSLVAGNIYLDGTERDILPYLPTGELEPGEVMPLHTTVFTGENNLIGEAFDATLVDGADLADILLQPLSNNGGPTRTHAIPVGSSAVDAGNSSLSSDLKTDQRGLQRIDGSNIDIGAYELGSTINVDTILDSVNPTDNDTSLREAILLADSDPADNTIVFDDQVFSAESSIQLIDRYYDNRSHKLEISDTDGSGDRLTILGPGADLLTIDGSTNGAQTIFKIDASAQVTISGLKVEGASQFGILNKGDLTLDEVEIVGNNDGVSSTPGSILTVTQSTVAENNLTGIEANDATVTISNTTISGNAHYGVYLTGTSDSDLTNVTITENALGGIMTSLDDLAINNSLVAGNIYLDGTERDILPYLPTGELEPGEVMPLHTTVFTGENNLIGEAFDATLVDGADLADILLQPLSNNGGPTRTHAIPVGSSAVDAGGFPSNYSVNDQLGEARLVGNYIDIGAYEQQTLPILIVNTIVDANLGEDNLSLREAISVAVPFQIISFAPELNGREIQLGDESDLIINKSLTIDATNLPDGLTLRAYDPTPAGYTAQDDNGASIYGLLGDGGRLFQVSGTGIEVSIKGLTLTGGDTWDSGGAIRNIDASLTLEDVQVIHNAAPRASGHVILGYEEELATTPHGVEYYKKVPICSDWLSGARGGGIFSTGDLTIIDSYFANNATSNLNAYSRDNDKCANVEPGASAGIQNGEIYSGDIYSLGDLTIRGTQFETIAHDADATVNGGLFGVPDRDTNSGSNDHLDYAIGGIYSTNQRFGERNDVIVHDTTFDNTRGLLVDTTASNDFHLYQNDFRYSNDPPSYEIRNIVGGEVQQSNGSVFTGDSFQQGIRYSVDNDALASAYFVRADATSPASFDIRRTHGNGSTTDWITIHVDEESANPASDPYVLGPVDQGFSIADELVFSSKNNNEIRIGDPDNDYYSYDDVATPSVYPVEIVLSNKDAGSLHISNQEFAGRFTDSITGQNEQRLSFEDGDIYTHEINLALEGLTFTPDSTFFEDTQLDEDLTIEILITDPDGNTASHLINLISAGTLIEASYTQSKTILPEDHASLSSLLPTLQAKNRVDIDNVTITEPRGGMVLRFRDGWNEDDPDDDYEFPQDLGKDVNTPESFIHYTEAESVLRLYGVEGEIRNLTMHESGSGGVFLNNSEIEISGSKFLPRKAAPGDTSSDYETIGPAILTYQSDTTITDSIFMEWTSGGRLINAGGIVSADPNSKITILGSTFFNNVSALSTVTISQLFRYDHDDEPTNYDGELHIKDSVFRGNVTGLFSTNIVRSPGRMSGAISVDVGDVLTPFSESQATVVDPTTEQGSSIVGNVSPFEVIIEGTEVSDNSGGYLAAGSGAGISLNGTIDAQIINSTIARNSSVPIAGDLSDASAENILLGGGVYASSMHSLQIENSTISNNRAQAGGGIFIYNTDQVDLTNVTITENSASQGGGIFVVGGFTRLNDDPLSHNTHADWAWYHPANSEVVTLVNTIISNNKLIEPGLLYDHAMYHTDDLRTIFSEDDSVTQDIWFSIPANNHPAVVNSTLVHPLSPYSVGNLIGNGGDTASLPIQDGAAGNIVGTVSSPKDPKLAPLGDYGGRTETHAILLGQNSPAIDAGYEIDLLKPDSVRSDSYLTDASPAYNLLSERVTLAEGDHLRVKPDGTASNLYVPRWSSEAASVAMPGDPEPPFESRGLVFSFREEHLLDKIVLWGEPDPNPGSHDPNHLDGLEDMRVVISFSNDEGETWRGAITSTLSESAGGNSKYVSFDSSSLANSGYVKANAIRLSILANTASDDPNVYQASIFEVRFSGAVASDQENGSFDLKTDQRGEAFLRVQDGDATPGSILPKIDIGAYESSNDLALLPDHVTAGLSTSIVPQHITIGTTEDEIDNDFSTNDLSLREAIMIANLYSGTETLKLPSTLQDGKIILSRGELRISDSLDIVGDGSAQFTIDASGSYNNLPSGEGTIGAMLPGPVDVYGNQDTHLPMDNAGSRNVLGSRVLNIDDGKSNSTNSAISVSLENLDITGGLLQGSGAGIRSTENLTLESSLLRENSAYQIYYPEQTFDLLGSALTDANLVGGALRRSMPEVYKPSGGGLYSKDGDLSILNSVIKDNSATTSGGGIHAEGGTFELKDSLIDSNIVRRGIYNGQERFENIDETGGGISIVDVIPDPAAPADAPEPALIKNTTISNNIALSADEVYEIYVIDISATTGLSSEVNNYAYTIENSYGGGVYVENSTLGIKNSTLSGNEAKQGGGLHATGEFSSITKVNVDNSTISNNLATIQQLDIDVRNIATPTGGSDWLVGGAGISAVDRSDVNLWNTTVTENRVIPIDIYDDANDAPTYIAGGIYFPSTTSTLTIDSSIVANNDGGYLELDLFALSTTGKPIENNRLEGAVVKDLLENPSTDRYSRNYDDIYVKNSNLFTLITETIGSSEKLVIQNSLIGNNNGIFKESTPHFSNGLPTVPNGNGYLQSPLFVPDGIGGFEDASWSAGGVPLPDARGNFIGGLLIGSADGKFYGGSLDPFLDILAMNGGLTATHAPLVQGKNPVAIVVPQTVSLQEGITEGSEPGYDDINNLISKAIVGTPTPDGAGGVTNPVAQTLPYDAEKSIFSQKLLQPNTWGTTSTGSGTDYFEIENEPVLLFDLGRTVAISEMITWAPSEGNFSDGYSRNEAKEFLLEFYDSDPDGSPAPAPIGSYTVNDRNEPTSLNGSHVTLLDQTYEASWVKVTVKDNFFGYDLDLMEDTPTDGDRVALGQIRFVGELIGQDTNGDFPSVDSLVIDAGSIFTSTLYDQRGDGYLRVYDEPGTDPGIDLGAYEVGIPALPGTDDLSLVIQNQISSLSEDTDTSNGIKIADLEVLYGFHLPYIFTLSGDDADLFEIIDRELWLKPNVAIDFELDQQLNLSIDVEDSSSTARELPGAIALSVDIVDQNERPEVSPQNQLISVNREVTDSGDQGLSISDFLSAVTDSNFSDQLGIAITATDLGDNDNGRLEYSLDSGITWKDVFIVSESAALLLPSSSSARIRYNLKVPFTGKLDNLFEFRAWDQTIGLPEQRVDISQLGLTKSSSAFSSAVETVSLEVNPLVNETSVVNVDSNYDQTTSQLYPSVAVDALGESIHVWSDPSGIYGQRVNADGAVASDQFLISSDVTASHPQIALAEDGTFTVVWQSSTGINLQRLDANGGLIASTNLDVTLDSSAKNPLLASEGGAFHVVWTADDSGSNRLFARSYDLDPNGVITEDPTVTQLTNSGSTTNDDLSSVALDKDGDLLLTWLGDVTGTDSKTFFAEVPVTGASINGPITGAQQVGLHNQISNLENLSSVVADPDDSNLAYVAWADHSNSTLNLVKLDITHGTTAPIYSFTDPNANGNWVIGLDMAIDTSGRLGFIWSAEASTVGPPTINHIWFEKDESGELETLVGRFSDEIESPWNSPELNTNSRGVFNLTGSQAGPAISGDPSNIVNRRYELDNNTLVDASIDVIGGLLINNTITKANNIDVTTSNYGGTEYITINGNLTTIQAADVLSMRILGSDQKDDIDLSLLDIDKLPALRSASITVDAGAGNDTIVGSSTEDELIGGLGNDDIFGGDGADIIVGGDGVDDLDGEEGNDIYVQLEGEEFDNDEIKDSDGSWESLSPDGVRNVAPSIYDTRDPDGTNNPSDFVLYAGYQIQLPIAYNDPETSLEELELSVKRGGVEVEGIAYGPNGEIFWTAPLFNNSTTSEIYTLDITVKDSGGYAQEDPDNPGSIITQLQSTQSISVEVYNENHDSDNDYLADGWELSYASDLTTLETFDSISNAFLNDDLDDLDNIDEYYLGTDPFVSDTDGDGVSDSDEHNNGTDPLDPLSKELPPASPERYITVTVDEETTNNTFDIGKFEVLLDGDVVETWYTFEKQTETESHTFVLDPDAQYELTYAPVRQLDPAPAGGTLPFPSVVDDIVGNYTLPPNVSLDGSDLSGGATVPFSYSGAQELNSNNGIQSEWLEIVDLKIFGLDNLIEGDPDDSGKHAAVIWFNNDFSKEDVDHANSTETIVDYVNNTETDFYRYIPDYQSVDFDNNYLADFTSATIYTPTQMLAGHTFDLSYDASLLRIWSNVESSPVLIPSGEITLNSPYTEIWIEGIGVTNSTDFNEKSISLTAKDITNQQVVAVDDVWYNVADSGIGVDGNRDGLIDFSNSYDRQLTFWFNNDREGYDSTNFMVEGEDLATLRNGVSDSFDTRIRQRRDLEDFAPLKTKYDDLLFNNYMHYTGDYYDLPTLTNGDDEPVISVNLSIANPDGSTTNLGPNKLQLFQSYADTQYSTTHVTDVLAAQKQVLDNYDNDGESKAYYKSIGNVIGTKTNYLEHMLQSENSFLFEAIGAEYGNRVANSNLTLIFETIVHYPLGGRTSKTHEIDLNLRDFQSFYTNYEIDYGQNSSLSEDLRHDLDIRYFDTPQPNFESKVLDAPFLGGNEKVVLVHGFNVNDGSEKFVGGIKEPGYGLDTKASFAETAFKRLYWQGFRGEFISFDWPALISGDWGENYNASDFQAYRSGHALKDILLNEGNILDDNRFVRQTTDPSINPVHLMAHSQGNIVAGEALRIFSHLELSLAEENIGNQNGIDFHPLVSSYTAMEAAVSAGAYGDDDFDSIINDLYYFSEFLNGGSQILGGIQFGDSLSDLLIKWIQFDAPRKFFDRLPLQTIGKYNPLFGAFNSLIQIFTDSIVQGQANRPWLDIYRTYANGPNSHDVDPITSELLSTHKPYYESSEPAAGKWINFYNPLDRSVGSTAIFQNIGEGIGVGVSAVTGRQNIADSFTPIGQYELNNFFFKHPLMQMFSTELWGYSYVPYVPLSNILVGFINNVTLPVLSNTPIGKVLDAIPLELIVGQDLFTWIGDNLISLFADDLKPGPPGGFPVITTLGSGNVPFVRTTNILDHRGSRYLEYSDPVEFGVKMSETSNMYEILAFAAQSASLPVGAKSVDFFDENVPIADLYDSPSNPDVYLPAGYDRDGNLTYNSQIQANHSFQFNHDAATTWEFWDAFMQHSGLSSTLHLALPSSAVAPLAASQPEPVSTLAVISETTETFLPQSVLMTSLSGIEDDLQGTLLPANDKAEVIVEYLDEEPIDGLGNALIELASDSLMGPHFEIFEEDDQEVDELDEFFASIASGDDDFSV